MLITEVAGTNPDHTVGLLSHVYRYHVEKATEIFMTLPGADDRVARCFFRKHLIHEQIGQPVEASDALEVAQAFAAEVVGCGAFDGKDVKDYDSLVSYYNK